MIPLDSYPPSAWRPNQKEGAELIAAVCASGQPFRFGLEMPCGSGKSLVALRAALSEHCPPCNILSTTRAHLRQYEETLKQHYPALENVRGGWAILRGRSFYSCCGSAKARAAGKGAPAGPLAGADADPREEWAGGKGCPRGQECLYLKAIEQCARAKVVLQCTIGFLYRKRYWGVPEGAEAPEDAGPNPRADVVDRDLIILDEAHEYLKVRREFETTRLDFWPELCSQPFKDAITKERQQGAYKAGYVLLEPKSNLTDMLRVELLYMLKPESLEKMRPARKLSADEWADMRDKFKAKLQARLDLLPARDAEQFAPCVSLQFTPGQIEKCELVQEPLFAYIQEKLAKVEVFTSATLSAISKTLKLDDFRSYPEIFDWEDSVTCNPLSDPDPESRANRALGADQLEALYNVPGRPLTLVLFMSKAHANAAVKGWGYRKPGLFVQSADLDLSELIEQARKPRTDDIAPMLVTYGGWVGTDLPGRKWLVLGSAPKSPLAPVHDARRRRNCGGGWNDFEKMAGDRIQLEQGLGRALRSESDSAVLIWINSQAFRDLGLNPQTGRVAP